MSKGGAGSRRKGSSYELEIVHAHKALGIAAKKMPLSGALGGEYSGDVQIAGYIAECKRSKKQCTRLYKALAQGAGSDLLFLRDDNAATLVVLPWETWECMLQQLNLKTLYTHTEEE